MSCEKQQDKKYVYDLKDAREKTRFYLVDFQRVAVLVKGNMMQIKLSLFESLSEHSKFVFRVLGKDGGFP